MKDNTMNSILEYIKQNSPIKKGAVLAHFFYDISVEKQHEVFALLKTNGEIMENGNSKPPTLEVVNRGWLLLNTKTKETMWVPNSEWELIGTRIEISEREVECENCGDKHKFCDRPMRDCCPSCGSNPND